MVTKHLKNSTICVVGYKDLMDFLNEILKTKPVLTGNKTAIFSTLTGWLPEAFSLNFSQDLHKLYYLCYLYIIYKINDNFGKVVDIDANFLLGPMNYDPGMGKFLECLNATEKKLLT